MNAYQLEQAAFDSACDHAEETIEYIQGYANGAFNLTVSDQIATKILDCRAESKAETEKNGEGQNNRWHFVQKPLQEIELEDVRVLDAEDYASDKNLWIECIDPDDTTPFDSVSYEERVRLAQSVIDNNK